MSSAENVFVTWNMFDLFQVANLEQLLEGFFGEKGVPSCKHVPSCKLGTPFSPYFGENRVPSLQLGTCPKLKTRSKLDTMFFNASLVN